MAKTRRVIAESLKYVDAVAETVDSRIPESSRNPELSDICADKPLILLLNKCDLADEKVTARWVSMYNARGVKAIPLDCKSGRGVNNFIPAVKTLLSDKIEQNARKGMSGKALRVMVVGIPNTGKSSFINKMAGKNRAKTADMPGVTRSNSWFPVGNGVELLDTPGVLWPKFDDPAVGDRLAFIGSVKDTVIDVEELSVRLIKILAEDYPEKLVERYGIKDFAGLTPYEVLELIGRKRGMLARGNEVDTERAANIILDEFRGGKLGRITLEKP